MTSTAILGLAFIKVNWDHLGKDYIGNFVPLVADCLRRSNSAIVSLPELQKEIQEIFGLELPQNSINVILKRAAKQKYVKQKHGVYYVNREMCGTLNVQATIERVNAIYSRVTNRLKTYISTKYKQEWTIEQTEKAIYDFLRDNSVSLIFSLAEKSHHFNRLIHSSRTTYFVGSFLEEIRSTDTTCLEDFEILVQGNLLVNALYFPEQGRINKRFRGTKVYLDTSIIVCACGYAGEARAAPSFELLSLLSEYGARLSCFSGTIDEVRGILDACASRMRRGDPKASFGSSMEYFIESGKTASDVELISVLLTHKLKAMGISIDEKPDYDSAYQIDEAGLEIALDEAIGYQNPKAKIHDVDCISSIARLRRGRESFQLEDVNTIFVTNNNALVRTTRVFFQSGSSPGAVALCLTNYALGNLLWLKNPTKAPKLPWKQLLADSYAAVQPSEHLWKRYLIEISKLNDRGDVTSDQYYLLRYSLATKSALMDLTKGEEQSFTSGTAQEVLEIAIQNIQSNTRQELQAEREKLRVANATLEELRGKEFAQQQRLREIANQVARYTRKGIYPLVILAVVIPSVYTFPWTFSVQQPSGWIFFVCMLLLFILGICNLVWGVPVTDLMDRFEQFIAEILQRRLFSIFIQTKNDGLDRL